MAVDDNWDPEYKAWVDSRPQQVRKLCYEFPLGSKFIVPGKGTCHLLGYTENDMLILSPIDPTEYYDLAHLRKFYLCAEHLRSGMSGHSSG